MNNIAIEVCSISKLYNVSKAQNGNPEFAALNNVSFTAVKGELIGLIGKNGSGKSTLLKILSSITKPSLGKINIHGNLHSILDIGSNFHPDLTGVENIEMSLMLQQTPKTKLAQSITQIIAFSGIGDFINSPIKQYSNGMFLRLAFSVALHSDADILLLDEVLQVGDVEFKTQSINLIKQLAQTGKTVLVASHDIQEITNLCNRCIWLENGAIEMDGSTVTVTSAYYRKYEPDLKLNYFHASFEQEGINKYKWTGNLSEIETTVQLLTIEIKNTNHTIELTTSFPIKILVTYYNPNVAENIVPLFAIHDNLNRPLFIASPTNSSVLVTENFSNKLVAECIIPSNFLNEGVFYLSVGFEQRISKTSYKSALVLLDLLFPFTAKKVIPESIKILAKENVRPTFEWQISPLT